MCSDGLMAALPFPDNVADEAGEGDGSGEDQRKERGQTADGGRDEEEICDDHRHEKGGDEGEPIDSVFAREIDRADP